MRKHLPMDKRHVRITGFDNGNPVSRSLGDVLTTVLPGGSMISRHPRYLVHEVSLTAQSGVHRDTSNHEVSSWGLQLGSHLLSCLSVWAQLLVMTCRNLPCRIRAEQRIRSGFSLGSPFLPKEWERFAVSGPNSHRHAYIRDMTALKAEF